MSDSSARERARRDDGKFGFSRGPMEESAAQQRAAQLDQTGHLRKLSPSQQCGLAKRSVDPDERRWLLESDRPDVRVAAMRAMRRSEADDYFERGGQHRRVALRFGNLSQRRMRSVSEPDDAIAAAASTRANKRTLRHLSEHDDEQVRLTVVRNPVTSQKLLMRMHSDPSPQIRGEAASTFFARRRSELR